MLLTNIIMSVLTLPTAEASGITLNFDKKRENIEKVCEKLLTLSIDIAEERAKSGYEHHKANSGKKYSEWCSCTTIFVLTRNLRRWVEAK